MISYVCLLKMLVLARVYTCARAHSFLLTEHLHSCVLAGFAVFSLPTSSRAFDAASSPLRRTSRWGSLRKGILWGVASGLFSHGNHES